MNGQELPWYRQFWPWFIIALPASAVIASIITFWLAVSHPDQLVVDGDEYQRLNSGLKAKEAVPEDVSEDVPEAGEDKQPGKSGSRSD